MLHLITCHFSDRCNQRYECVDKSDEHDCFCPENQFQCQCYKNHPVGCNPNSPGCIQVNQYHDGKKDCSDGSDETQFENQVFCDDCEVLIARFFNLTECNKANFFSCNNSSCYNVPSLGCDSNYCNTTDLICISNCSSNSTKQCGRGFQCDDGSLGLGFQFCDGVFDCPDHSDEIRNQPGFKCFGRESDRACVLPQRNLYDDVAQCSDESDLCEKNLCFECFDRRLLISSKQVCDGVFDCFDFSDECLCGISFNNPLCNARFPSIDGFTLECSEKNYNRSDTFGNYSVIQKPSLICQSKWSDGTKATLCDGRPECRDLSDECNCENPPEFCNDTCHSDYYIGDRYCDGIEDDFYKIINKSNCPKGFDEVKCPKRFYCPAGGKISIDIDYICDGKIDCDDYSDESNCPSNNRNIFSSFKEMIGSVALRIVFWLIGIFAVIGNLYVFLSTAFLLKTKKLNQSYKYQAILILNISVADLIMGIYLIAISVFSILYSGFYGQVDKQWRSSLRCSIIGSLTLLSCEASSLFLVFLSGYRLYTIIKPLNAAFISTVKFTLGVAFIWLISLALAIVPIFFKELDYFSITDSFSNRLTHPQVWDKFNVTKLACRLAKLSNKSIEGNGTDWASTQNFLKHHFPDYIPVKEFTYYGQTSVCMPRFQVVPGDNTWEYTLAVISLNFVLFLFVLISYIVIFANFPKNKVELKDKENMRMQRRTSRITITNLLCWIAICIMGFVFLSGVNMNDNSYIVSTAVLLSINSALNPLLYSPFFDVLVESCRKSEESNINQPKQ